MPTRVLNRGSEHSMGIFRVTRDPDQIIGKQYLHRWYIIPHNRLCNIYLHRYIGSDDDRALHDHPWFSVSFLMAGCLKEITPNNMRFIRRFIPVFRSARFAHRLELHEGPAWTLFITGPKLRSWGFLCPNGWTHWRHFTDESGNQVGSGCE